MKKILSIIKAMAVGITALFCMCTLAPLAGGNSSQTGNNGIAVASVSQNISGTTRPGARISIYDQNYRAYKTPSGVCDSTIADDSGRFVFSIALEGHYNLLVQDVHRGGTAFIPRIPVFVDSVYRDTVDTLRHPGFIAGVATDTLGRTFALSYVFINGSPFYTVTKNNGDFLLGPLPAGPYKIGITANFQVIDPIKGQLAPLLVTIDDPSVTTVVPDSITPWHR